MTRRLSLLALAGVIVAAGAVPAAAQSEGSLPPASPFRGSVPQGTATAEPLRAVAEGHGRSRAPVQPRPAAAGGGPAVGARRPLARPVRPAAQRDGSVSERRQVINLEAFGFPAPDPIVGPFNVFDARVGLSQPVVDLRALHDARRHRATRNVPRPAACGRRASWSCWWSVEPLSRGGHRREPHRRRRRAAGDGRGAAGARPAISRPRGSSPASTCCAPTSQVQRLRQRRIARRQRRGQGQAAAGPRDRAAARAGGGADRRDSV